MSHFSVAIITEGKPSYSEIEELLEPYSENMEVDPYISETPQQYLEKKRKEYETFKNTTYSEYLKNPVEFEKQHPDKDVLDYVKTFMEVYYNSSDEKLLKERKEYYGDDDDDEYLDENGNLISTYNPNSKWDWWSIGGRFSGTIVLNNGNSSDSASIKDINFNENLDIDSLKSKYEKRYLDLITNGDILSPQYYKLRYPTIEDFIFSIVTFSTFAVLDEDGWHEQGEMGWFGCSSATESDELNWNKNFFENFIKKHKESDKDYWLTVVDCHI